MRIKTVDYRPVQAVITATLTEAAPFDISPSMRAQGVIHDLMRAGYVISLASADPVLGNVIILDAEGEDAIRKFAGIRGEETQADEDDARGPTLAPRDVHTLPGGRRSSVMTLNEKRILQAVVEIVPKAKPADAAGGNSLKSMTVNVVVFEEPDEIDKDLQRPVPAQG
ncbi:hypothetical protein IPV08_07235 [Methylobacterium sp. SD274]|jgi:hypothetical protein|uniref:hypothetical protein n=1 Tax=Methylobacterium sp. SD274 TaxID=2782009 RepID=UPI001A968699|nr:hypothetical protein [Methylobacterium sp. SD274]MBO1019757.1 hypothetical protein [Methylobacterium sp. SD274]